jgi:hypothetical protein
MGAPEARWARDLADRQDDSAGRNLRFKGSPLGDVTADKPARVKAAGRLGLRRIEAAAGGIDI